MIYLKPPANMKTIFLLFACTCLLSSLSALNFPLEDENFNAETFESAFEESDDDSFENFFLENKEENLIVPYPSRPHPTTSTSTPTPTTTTTTTTTEKPSSTPRPRPTRPTRPTPTRPTPTRPTPTRPTPPRPTTSPRPIPTRPAGPFGTGNAQIYENTVRGLGPFASQLINIVLNREDGRQKTVQENDILYNFKSMRQTRDLNDEETEE